MGIGGLGMAEMVLIFLVVLLLFGAKRLPEIGSALGKGIREFKGSVREIENELRTPEESKKPPAQSSGQGEPRRLSEGTLAGPTPDETLKKEEEPAVTTPEDNGTA